MAPQTPRDEREFDVVLFGATSITGRRVAAYLDAQGARWAPAGRDAGRVASLLAGDGVAAPAAIVADVADPVSLRAMAGRARVVLNLVGPYTRHGEPVIAACVAAGTDYADLSGEIPFVRRMIDAHGAAARRAGTKIVQVCGFEALPPDIAVALAARAADEPLAEVELEIAILQQPKGMPRASDLLSGGTIQSVVEAATDDDARSLADPSTLLDDADRVAQVRSLGAIRLAPRRRGGTVLAPMAPAAFINPPVIHRTAALLGMAPFRYREGTALPGSAVTLAARYAAAGLVAGVQLPLLALGRSPAPVRHVARAALSRALPGAGFGPAPDRIEAWRWRMDVVARGVSGSAVSVVVDGRGHPGYLATSRMLGEAGLLLAEPGATPDRAGHLTPAAALGLEHVERFARAGLTFTVSG